MRLSFLIAVTIGFSLGIFLAERGGSGIFWLVGVAAVSSFWNRGRTYGLLICASALCAVIILVYAVRTDVQAWRPQYGRPVTLTGVVVDVQTGRTIVGYIRNPHLPGMIVLPVAIPVGRTVTWTCTPTRFETRPWMYLAKRWRARCETVTITHISDRAEHWHGWLSAWRTQTVLGLQRRLRSDAAALAVGFLVGDDQYFSDELRQAFQATGTTHLVALSGFNVSIILVSLVELTVPWLGRRLGSLVGLAAVLALVVISGAPASVVRAAVMAVVVLAARALGRPVQPVRPLLYAILSMLALNPFLISDLGFQLSVASTIGLMQLSAGLALRLNWLPDFFSIRTNMATTLAASAATLPIILGTFQRLSLVSVLVNTIVLPLVPFAMALAGIMALTSTWPVVHQLVQPITELWLITILIVIRSGAKLPFAFVTLSGWIGPAVIAIVAMIVVRFGYATRHS